MEILAVMEGNNKLHDPVEPWARRLVWLSWSRGWSGLPGRYDGLCSRIRQ